MTLTVTNGITSAPCSPGHEWVTSAPCFHGHEWDHVCTLKAGVGTVDLPDACSQLQLDSGRGPCHALLQLMAGKGW